MPRVAILDFETRAAHDLKKTGAEAYVECPHFAASCLTWAFDDCDGRDQHVHGLQLIRGEETMGAQAHGEARDAFRELAEHVRNGGTTVAHNHAFEAAVWRELRRRDPDAWPELRPAQMVCTQALARAVGMPAALFDLACALRLPLAKDADGHRVMLKLCKPYKPRKHEKHLQGPLFHEEPADLARQLAYCVQDTIVERAAWRLLPALIPDEAETWLLDREINDRGIHVDTAAAAHCLRVVTAERARLNANLLRLTGGFVGTSDSVAALLSWLAAHDCTLPDLRKNTVEAALERADIMPCVREALMIRREGSRSSTAKLQAALLGVCRDGRMHGLFGYHGAGPGRWIAYRFQPHNMMRAPESFDEHDCEDVFGWTAAA